MLYTLLVILLAVIVVAAVLNFLRSGGRSV
jgi:hypothetical protein